MRLEIEENITREEAWSRYRNPRRCLNYLDLVKHKIELESQPLSQVSAEDYLSVIRLELHPTNLCNLNCSGCIEYGRHRSSPNSSFPFHEIEKLNIFQAKSIVISGGGEPTLYKSGEYDFNDLILALRRTNPDVKIGLITNGTHLPNGSWQKEVDWVRISLDAHTREIYKERKGSDLFESVLNNFLALLNTPLQTVSIGFLYTKSNILSTIDMAKAIYKLVEDSPEYLKKTGVQFRSFHNDLSNKVEYDFEDVSSDDIANLHLRLKLLDNSSSLYDFLKVQTNLMEIKAGSASKAEKIDSCFFGHISSLIRANGDLLPCCAGINHNDYIIANVLTDDLIKIADQKADFMKKIPPTCATKSCLDLSKNQLLEHYLNSVDSPEISREIRNNVFL